MIGMLSDTLRREGRRTAWRALGWCLSGAWLSVAAYLWLASFWPAHWAALAVSAVVLLIFAAATAVQAMRHHLSQRRAPEPAPPMSEELVAQLEQWAGDKPWMAVGLSAGLGFAAARNDQDLRHWLERLPELLAGAESAMRAGQRPPQS